MIARTTHGTGINQCILRFYYEDFHGDLCYGHYDEATKVIDDVYLTSSIHNLYYNCTERVHSVKLTQKPTITFIRQFIIDTLKYLKW